MDEEKEAMRKQIEYLETRIEFLRSRMNEGIEKTCQYFCALPECAKEMAERASRAKDF